MDTFAEHELWAPYYGEPGELLQHPTSQYPATTSHAISCFENSCKIAVIISDIMTHFYCRRAASNTGEEFRRIRASLDDWRANSPAHLVYDPDSLPALSPPPHILTQKYVYMHLRKALLADGVVYCTTRPSFFSIGHSIHHQPIIRLAEMQLILLKSYFSY